LVCEEEEEEEEEEEDGDVDKGATHVLTDTTCNQERGQVAQKIYKDGEGKNNQ
jgi:hypothetical protein